MDVPVSSTAAAGSIRNETFSSGVSSSGVSWGAVIGGAFAAAASYLVLLALGAGLGLSTESPWRNTGGPALGTGTIIWLIVIEIAASALGGYMTGRMRTKWVLLHTDEVFFRDTANGFLAWCVALVLSVGFLVSAATATIAGVPPVGSEEGRATAETRPLIQNAYFVDRLFRSDKADIDNKANPVKPETGRILAHALRDDQTGMEDRNYLAQLTVAETGLSLPDAEKRVSDVIAQARQAEDATRKETARLLLWFFLSLLVGAFSASYAATIGGRQRDHVKTI